MVCGLGGASVGVGGYYWRRVYAWGSVVGWCAGLDGDVACDYGGGYYSF